MKPAVISPSTTSSSSSSYIDKHAEARTKISAMISAHSHPYSAEEDSIIEANLDHFNLFFGAHGSTASSLQLPCPMTEAKQAVEATKSGNHSWGYSATTIRSTPRDTLSYVWIHSRAAADEIEKTIDEAPNDHNKLVYAKWRVPNPFVTRDFLGRCLWKQLDPDTYLFVAQPDESEKRRVTSAVVRGRYTCAMKMTRVDDSLTRVELVCRLEYGGFVPEFISDMYVGSMLSKVTEIQNYFESIRALDDYDEEDGRMIGEHFIVRKKAEKERGGGVLAMFSEYSGLHRMGSEHSFFQPLLARVLEYRIENDEDVSTTFKDLSRSQGKAIGGGLVAALHTGVAEPATAVSEWIQRFPALVQLDAEQKWFRPMMKTIASRLAEHVWTDNFVRRVSIEAMGNALGAISPEEMADDDSNGEQDDHVASELFTLEHPVSLSYHTFRTNVDGLISALPALIFMSISNIIVRAVLAREGIWGDRHSVLCTICMSSIEILTLFVRGLYSHGKLVFRWTLSIVFYNLFSYFIFDWRPALFTPLVMTASVWWSHNATYFYRDESDYKRKSFLVFAAKNLVFVVFLHLVFVVVIYAQVIPTRLLSEGDYHPLVTVAFTGAGIPLLAACFRVYALMNLRKYVADWAKNDKRKNASLIMYQRLVKMFSLAIQIGPTVVLYFNTGLRYAVLSAASQLVSELVSKVFIIWITRKRLRRYAKMNGGGVDGAREGRAMRLLANRWSAEIVAEKGCILVAALIAAMYFGDNVDGSPPELALVGAVFFGFEFLTDVLFVWIMDSFYGVPMLSAVPHEDLRSKENLASMGAMAFTFNAMAACIAMAASIPLKRDDG
jgi:hypothetical protein